MIRGVSEWYAVGDALQRGVVANGLPAASAWTSGCGPPSVTEYPRAPSYHHVHFTISPATSTDIAPSLVLPALYAVFGPDGHRCEMIRTP